MKFALVGHMHHLVDSKSIEIRALRTATSRRALLKASLAHSCVQSESKSGSNPFSMDRDPLLRAGRLDAPAARSLQHQERNNLRILWSQGRILVEVVINVGSLASAMLWNIERYCGLGSKGCFFTNCPLWVLAESPKNGPLLHSHSRHE